MRCIYSFIILLFSSSLYSNDVFSVKGIVLDKTNQEPIAGANIIIENDDNGTSSDNEGRFSIELKAPSENKLVFTTIGFKDTSIVINQTNNDQTIKIFLNRKAVKMNAITVHSHKESNQSKAPSSITMVGNKLEKNIISDLATTLSR